MEHVETGTIVLAALSSIWAIVGTILLFWKKLRPVGRKYPDRPQLWVPVGFYSYTFIHWMMVYGYWAASHFPEPDASLSFYPVSRGITQMVGHSLNKLDDFEGIKLSLPIIQMSQEDVAKQIVVGMKLNDFVANTKEFDSKFEATQNSLQSFDNWIVNVADEACKQEIEEVFTEAKDKVTDVSELAKSIQSETTNKDKLTRISGELIGVFNAEKLSGLGNERIKQNVDEKKDLLKHFMVDMNSMDKIGNKMIKKLRPLTTNKIGWIHQVTYYEIFVTLAISAFILVGFGRVETMMSVRWPTRLCAFSIPLSALNILFFAIFIGLMASFECPKQTEKIGLHQFQTAWKPRLSNVAPSKICSSARPTFFSNLDDRTSIDKNEIVNLLKDDITRTGVVFGGLKVKTQSLSEIMENLKVIVNKTKSIAGKSCLGKPEALKLVELSDMFENLLEEGAKFEKIITIHNEHLNRTTANLDGLLNTFYENAQTSIENGIEETKLKIKTADIACDMVKWHVKKCQNLICTELDVQLNELWLVLGVVMMFLLGLFCLNIVVYRTIALWEIEFHSSTPPPQQPQVQILRRHRPRRRLHAHIF